MHIPEFWQGVLSVIGIEVLLVAIGYGVLCWMMQGLAG